MHKREKCCTTTITFTFYFNNIIVQTIFFTQNVFENMLHVEFLLLFTNGLLGKNIVYIKINKVSKRLG